MRQDRCGAQRTARRPAPGSAAERGAEGADGAEEVSPTQVNCLQLTAGVCPNVAGRWGHHSGEDSRIEHAALVVRHAAAREAVAVAQPDAGADLCCASLPALPPYLYKRWYKSYFFAYRYASDYRPNSESHMTSQQFYSKLHAFQCSIRPPSGRLARK